MAIQILGDSHGSIPFGRTFFNVTLGDMIGQGRQKSRRLTLFLGDGSTLEVCRIEELCDDYLTVQAYLGSNEVCDVATHLIPYGLIYRIEIAPEESPGGRMGFRWTAPARKPHTSRRPKP